MLPMHRSQLEDCDEVRILRSTVPRASLLQLLILAGSTYAGVREVASTDDFDFPSVLRTADGSSSAMVVVVGAILR